MARELILFTAIMGVSGFTANSVHLY